MSDASPHEDREQQAIQIDVYGFKADVHPTDAPHGGPSTWGEVCRRINRHLMAIAVEVFGLPAVVLTSLRRIVSGIGRLGSRDTLDVARAHRSADTAEGAKQQQLQSATTPRPSPTEASEKLRLLIAALLEQGVEITFRRLPDGRMAILAVGGDTQLAEQLVAARVIAEDSNAAEGGAGSVLADRVRQKLRASGHAQLTNVVVTAQGATVTLQGNVQSFYLRQVALAAARCVDGVEDVDNRLHVE